MKAHLECVPCFLRQALEAIRMSSEDEVMHEEALRKVTSYLTSYLTLKAGLSSMTQPFKTLKKLESTA